MPVALNVNPAMIKWAREDAGFELEDLPKSLKKAEKWESGEEKPTWADLRKLAKKYKMPSFFYFLPQPPKEVHDFLDFRSDEKTAQFSPSLRLEIRKAKYRRNAYIHIHEDMGIKIPNFKRNVFKTDSEEKLATHIRNYLGIDLETQKEWVFDDKGIKKYQHQEFLKNWRQACFDLGILVFEMENIDESELSGCSIYYDSCPIILINGKNSPNKRIFTLMHELAHLTQGVSAVCDVKKHNCRESFCNRVASEVLVPKNTLNPEEVFFKNGKLNLSSASHIYGVSKQTMVYRLYSSRLIGNELKEQLILEIEEKNTYDKLKKAQKNRNSSPRISTLIKKKKYDGEPYARLVLQAYENNVITAPKAVKYLDASIDAIENDLYN